MLLKEEADKQFEQAGEDAVPVEAPAEEEPGFEVVLAAAGLLLMTLLIKRKNRPISLKKYNINHSTCSVSFNIRRYYHIPICFSNRA